MQAGHSPMNSVALSPPSKVFTPGQHTSKRSARSRICKLKLNQAEGWRRAARQRGAQAAGVKLRTGGAGARHASPQTRAARPGQPGWAPKPVFVIN